MFCYLCEYLVVPDRVDAFREAYGQDGPWAQLFRRDPAYVRTELHRDTANPRRFITVDHWTSQAACMSFRDRHRDEYDGLDAAFAEYKEAERYIGDFEPA